MVGTGSPGGRAIGVSPRGGGGFFGETNPPGGNSRFLGRFYFFRKSIYPGEKTPCESFQTERKVMRDVWGRGTPIAAVDVSDEEFDLGEESSEVQWAREVDWM